MKLLSAKKKLMHSQKKNHNEEIIKEKITSFPPFEKTQVNKV